MLVFVCVLSILCSCMAHLIVCETYLFIKDRVILVSCLAVVQPLPIDHVYFSCWSYCFPVFSAD